MRADSLTVNGRTYLLNGSESSQLLAMLRLGRAESRELPSSMKDRDLLLSGLVSGGLTAGQVARHYGISKAKVDGAVNRVKCGRYAEED